MPDAAEKKTTGPKKNCKQTRTGFRYFITDKISFMSKKLMAGPDSILQVCKDKKAAAETKISLCYSLLRNHTVFRHGIPGPLTEKIMQDQESYYWDLMASVSSGMNSRMSSTMPTSATWKIGALGFLFTATIKGFPLTPPRC